MNYFKNLTIDQPVISLWAGGQSAFKYQQSEYDYIKSKSFCIAVNEYQPLSPHARIWYDRKVITELMNAGDKPAGEIWVTRINGISYDSAKKIDYVFDDAANFLVSNFTVVTAVQHFVKYWPTKKVLLFGVDCLNEDRRMTLLNGQVILERREGYGKTLMRTKDLLESLATDEPEKYAQVYNCSLKSAVQVIQKKSYLEII